MFSKRSRIFRGYITRVKIHTRAQQSSTSSGSSSLQLEYPGDLPRGRSGGKFSVAADKVVCEREREKQRAASLSAYNV